MGTKIIIEPLCLVKRHTLIVIVVVSLLCLYEVYRTYGVVICSFDTLTYRYAAISLQHGSLDIFRTPCYPMIMNVCWKASSSTGYGLLIIVQIFMFYVSVCNLYWTMLRLNIAKNIATIVTTIYALYPQTILAALAVLTESFSISVSVCLITFFVKWLKNCRFIDFIGMSMSLLFLLFLRPSFLYILVALAAILIILGFRSEYKKCAQLLSILIVSSCIMLGYCKLIEAKSGVFTPSTVGIYNTGHNFISMGKLERNNSEFLDKCLAFNLECMDDKGEFVVYDKCDGTIFPPAQVDHELQQVKQQDRFVMLKVLFRNLQNSVYNTGENIKFGRIVLDFGLIYLVLFLITCVLCYRALNERKLPLVACLLWLMCIGNLLVNLIGAYSDWSRLFLPSFPLLLILIAQMCNLFKIWRMPSNELIQK